MVLLWTFSQGVETARDAAIVALLALLAKICLSLSDELPELIRAVIRGRVGAQAAAAAEEAGKREGLTGAEKMERATQIASDLAPKSVGALPPAQKAQVVEAGVQTVRASLQNPALFADDDATTIPPSRRKDPP